MSETLSAEQPYTHDELEHLAENMRHPTVQRIVAPAEQKTINRLLATIEALQAEVTTLRTALEEVAGLLNEMHLPLQGHRAARCTLRTDFCVTAEHVREALHGRE